MKDLCFLLILLSVSLLISAQTDPQLNFEDKNKVFGDNAFALGANSPLSSGTISYTFISGDEIISISGDTASINKAGSAVVRATIAEEGDYTSSSVEATINVGKRNVTLGLNPIQITYGEVYHSGRFDYYLVEGSLAYNDHISIITQNTVPSCSEELDSSPDYGYYDIFLSFESEESNYIVATTNGSLDVKQRLISVIIDDKQKLYGDDKPVLTLTFPNNDLQNGDTPDSFDPKPNLFCDVNKNTPVGPPIPIVINNSPNSNWNYEFDIIPGALDVKPAQLEVSILDTSRYYWEEDPVLKGATISGFKNGENPEVIDQVKDEILDYSGNRIFGQALNLSINANISDDVGESLILHDETLKAQNYDFNYSAGTFTIKPAPLTISIRDLYKPVGGDVPQLKRDLNTPDYIKHVPNENTVDLEIINALSTACTKNSAVDDYVIDYSFDINGSLPNYEIKLEKGTMHVVDTAQFTSGPICEGACRDSSATIYLLSKGLNPIYEWWIRFPSGEFTPITATMADSMGVKGKTYLTSSMVFQSAQNWQTAYELKCNLFCNFKEDSKEPGSPSFPSSATSSISRISIKDTPPLAKVTLKGKSILICRDLNQENTYQWGIGTEEIIGAIKPYYDIGNDYANRNNYWVKTTYANTCSTKSTLASPGGFETLTAPFKPDAFEISIYPIPLGKAAEGINVDVLEPKTGTYTISVFNHKGELVQDPYEDDDAIEGEALHVFLKFETLMQAGIYFVDFRQVYGRDVKKLLIYEK